jgi:hypothetical protein
VTRYPAVRQKLVRNPCRVGASQSRNRGVAEAANDFILFCDDDGFLEPGYALTCLDNVHGGEATPRMMGEKMGRS